MSTPGKEDRLQAIAVVLALACVLVLAFFAAPWYEEEGVAARTYVRPEGRVAQPRPQPDISPPPDLPIQDAVEGVLATEHPGLRSLVTEGRVVLTGTVASHAACARATALVASVRGVVAVECRAQVPVATEGADSVRRALAAEPGLGGLEISAETAGGRLVLGGTVPTLGHKLLALRVAGAVRGVPLVQDRLQVAPSTRPPAHTRGEIERRLHGDSLLDAARVEVDLQEGVAFLRGSVPTLADKERAVVLASVPGVTRIDVDELQVRPSTREPLRAANDLDIRRDVQESLHADPRFGKGLTIEVGEGLVTLRGVVRTLAVRRAAGRAAAEVAGVRRVANRLRVEPTRAADLARVEESLARNAWVREGSVRATLRDGVVRLEGSVDSVFQRVQAEAAVAAVEGVIAVDNLLYVFDMRPPPLDPFVGDPSPEDVEGLALPAVAATVSDREILAAVVERLRWNAVLAGTPIQVEVDDGHVTLSGKVRGPAEARAAVASALRAGAVRVDDDLEF